MTNYSVVVLARGLRRRSGRDVPSTGNSDLLPHFGAEEENHDYVLKQVKLRFYTCLPLRWTSWGGGFVLVSGEI